jgi:hypothetical protein
MAGSRLQATPRTMTLDSPKQVQVEQHQCHAPNRSQKVLGCRSYSRQVLGCRSYSRQVLGCSCSRQVLGCSPAQKVHLGLRRTWKRIWRRLNKETLVVEGGILDRSHCQRSTAGAYPSDGPEVVVVSLTMNT